jgi:hypothetical protein
LIAWRPRWCPLQIDPFDETVKREIEINPGLLAIGDDVQAGRHLIVDRSDDGVVLQFGDIVGTEAIQILYGKLQPAWKGVRTYNRRT